MKFPVALLSSVACELAPLRIVLLCVFLYLFFYFFTSLLIRVSSAMIMYDRRTLLDIGQRYTNLIQNTLSAEPAWPLEILRNTELNTDHLNNRRRRRKHRGRRAGIRNRLRKRAHSPPLPSILLANVQSLENKMDDLRARISFQRDIRDCNIFCYIYIYAFSRRFYPKRLTLHSSYSFYTFISSCFPWESNP